MTHIIALAHQVAEIHSRYIVIHDGVFSFSIRRILPLSHTTDVDYCAYEKVLDNLQVELKDIQVAVTHLKSADLVKTSAVEFRTVLEDYIIALSDTMDKLHLICARLCQDGRQGISSYSTTRLNLDKMAYDELIQRYKRLGRRLNRLLATL